MTRDRWDKEAIIICMDLVKLSPQGMQELLAQALRITYREGAQDMRARCSDRLDELPLPGDEPAKGGDE